MSRVGKKPIALPPGVEFSCADRQVKVKGPKGSLTLTLPAGISLAREKDTVLVQADGPECEMLRGTVRALLANMLLGVTRGYVKELEIQGVGFKAALQGRQLVFNLGFSSPKQLPIPEGIDVKVADNVNLVVSGADKQLVGDFSARIKALYPAEPYKGKGIRFKGEYVRRKAGKTVA